MALLASELIEVLSRIKKMQKKEINLCMIGKLVVCADLEDIIRVVKLYGFEYDEQVYEEIKREDSFPWDTYKIFRMFGINNVHAVDYSEYEGADIIMDLNTELPEQYVEKFDVVINGGTLEHVFDVRTAMNNITNLVKPGGFIFHSVPCAGWVDHGFYSFSPTFFLDYYSSKEFDISSLYLMCLCQEEGAGRLDSDVVLSQDCRLFPSSQELNCYIQKYLNNRRINICCFCEKKESGVKNQIPLQGCYQTIYEYAGVDYSKLLNFFQAEEKVVIYGAGNDCNLIIDELHKCDMGDKIDFIFDSDIRRSGNVFRGYQICYPTEKQLRKVEKIFISSRKYGDAIQHDLENKGFAKEKLFKLNDYINIK